MASRRRPTPSTRRQVLKGGAAVACALAAGTAAATGSGLYVPPEETRHEATLMMWPNSRAVYDDPVFLDMTQRTIAEIGTVIELVETRRDVDVVDVIGAGWLFVVLVVDRDVIKDILTVN